MSGKKFSKYQIINKKVDVPINESGVRINVRLDASLNETSKLGDINTGGIVLFTARSAVSRKHIEKRRRNVTQLILWALEGQGNYDPLPRLCMSVDLFGQKIIKASGVSGQYRGYVESACKEAALKWDSIAPPKDYDGPNWQ